MELLSRDWKGNAGSSYDNDEIKEMQRAISMMQRLALRHEDSINLMKLEFSFVAHMRLNIPASVVHILYVAADGWRKLKAQEPQKLDRPMRTSLFVCFFAEPKTRIQALDSRQADVDKMAELGWLVKGVPVTWQFLKWDGAAQRNVIDTTKPPLTNAEVLEHIDVLLANAVATNSLARFHPTRPLAEGMQGESIVFLIQVGNLGDACISIRSSLKALCHNAVLQLVATQLKPDRAARSFILQGNSLCRMSAWQLAAGSRTLSDEALNYAVKSEMVDSQNGNVHEDFFLDAGRAVCLEASCVFCCARDGTLRQPPGVDAPCAQPALHCLCQLSLLGACLGSMTYVTVDAFFRTPLLRPRRLNMPPQKKQRRAQMAAVQISEGEGACGAIEDSLDHDCLLDDAECLWSPEVVPARTLSGIFMVGSCPLTSYEQDLRYAYARQQVYLIRNVSLAGLCVPSACKAEALACGMVSSGQATWGQLQRLLSFLPEDIRIRWNQENLASSVSTQRPKCFTIGAWNFGNMAGVMRSSLQFPWTARALAGVVSTFNEELCFSTCTLTLNTAAAPHKDSRNLVGSCNLALPCSSTQGGEIFVEDKQGMTHLSQSGPAGHVISVQEAAMFPPHKIHASMPWKGDRLLLLSFHIGQYANLKPNAVRVLQGESAEIVGSGWRATTLSLCRCVFL
ncbi:unnamed protein product [Symbiodinium sp. KB8]|nr:unnamed protein product [Symbiodinium sp. KB8]